MQQLGNRILPRWPCRFPWSESWFEKHLSNAGQQTVRLINTYPPARRCVKFNQVDQAGAHTDWGGMTFSPR